MGLGELDLEFHWRNGAHRTQLLIRFFMIRIMASSPRPAELGAIEAVRSSQFGREPHVRIADGESPSPRSVPTVKLITLLLRE
jgi:hypothetical protein